MEHRAVGMGGQPTFPAWSIEFSAPIADSGGFITAFLKARFDDSWLLLTSTAVAGNRQLWSAWLALRQRARNDSMRSVGQDGEFLRLIAGTHHISQGFRRAGLCDGDEGAWLVHLPSADTEEVDVLPELDLAMLEQRAQKIAVDCGFTLTDAKPQPTAAGLVRLGVFVEGDPVLAELTGKAEDGDAEEEANGGSAEVSGFGEAAEGGHGGVERDIREEILLEDFFIGHIHTSDLHG